MQYTPLLILLCVAKMSLMKLESVNLELKYKQTVVIPFLSFLILIMMKVNLIQQMVSLPEGLYL